MPPARLVSALGLLGKQVLTYHDIRTGNLDAIRIFVADNNPNCQIGHGTPLTLASFEGRVNVVKLLLASNADPNYRALNTWTPLIAAANDGRTRIAELLLDAGADPNLADNSGQSPLHHLCFCPRRTAPDLAKLLLERGVCRHLTDNLGRTAFELAIANQLADGYNSTVSQDLLNALR